MCCRFFWSLLVTCVQSVQVCRLSHTPPYLVKPQFVYSWLFLCYQLLVFTILIIWIVLKRCNFVSTCDFYYYPRSYLNFCKIMVTSVWICHIIEQFSIQHYHSSYFLRFLTKCHWYWNDTTKKGLSNFYLFLLTLTSIIILSFLLSQL